MLARGQKGERRAGPAPGIAMMPRSGPVKERPSVGLQAVSARPGRPAWQLPQRAFVTTRIAWDVPCRTARSGAKLSGYSDLPRGPGGGGSVTLCPAAFQSDSRTGGADSGHDSGGNPGDEVVLAAAATAVAVIRSPPRVVCPPERRSQGGNDCIRGKSSRLAALRPGWSDQLVVRAHLSGGGGGAQ